MRKKSGTFSGVSRVGLKGVSKSRKCRPKWPVKVGSSNGVTPLNKTNLGRRGGGVPGNQKTPLDTPLTFKKNEKRESGMALKSVLVYARERNCFSLNFI